MTLFKHYPSWSIIRYATATNKRLSTVRSFFINIATKYNTQ